MFVSASRLSDRARVWVERSPRPDDNIDAIMETLFGPPTGRESWEIAACNGRRYAQEAIDAIPTFE